jgi:small-conductance mechanosensitive channel
MLDVILAIGFLYLFALGLKLALRGRGDIRQAGFALALLVVPTLIVQRFTPEVLGYSGIDLFGVEVDLGWALRTIGLVIAGACLLAAGLSWLRRMRTGEEMLDFHRFLLKVGVVVVALPIALKLHVPHLDFGKVLASIAVGSVIFGLALQRPLANLFSGVTNELDDVLRPGEFVQVGSTGPRGFVVAKSWRGIQMLTLDHETVFVPNDSIFNEPVWNFARPTAVVRRRITVRAGYAHPPALVKEALHGVFSVETGVLADPPPLVRVRAFEENGVSYETCYWIRGMREDENIADRLRTAIWYAFELRGIEIPLPHRVLLPIDTESQRRRTEERKEDRAALEAVFARTEPFRSYASRADRAYLARNGVLQRFEPGELVVRRGDQADSMYVICSGDVEVLVSPTKKVTLGPDGFFGDIGLLRRTQRTADVVAGSGGVEVIRLGRIAIEGLLSRASALRRELFEISDERLAEVLAQEPPEPPGPTPPAPDELRSAFARLSSLLRPW